MNQSLGVAIETLVAILLVLTIGYCMLLNKRLQRLKADEHSLKAVIGELITATEIAERAIGGLKHTVRDVNEHLGGQLTAATQMSAHLKHQLAEGDAVIRRLSLALTATIPSLEELRGLESVPEGEKIDRWVEVLLHDRRCADTLAERFARAYVGTEGGPFIVFRRRKFVSWLSDQLDANVPYNRIVRELIVRAQRAASGGNLQSWNVYALANTPLTDFKRIVAARIEREDPRHAKSEYPIYPEPMFGPYKERREAHGFQLYGSLGIDRDDSAGRLAQYKKNFEFFNAPVGLFITIDRRHGPGQWADLGGYVNALAFLARGHGLDTCPQVLWIRLHKIVGAFLKFPAEQMLYCGMGIGHGDRSHPVNSFRTKRAELHEFCKFFGFD